MSRLSDRCQQVPAKAAAVLGSAEAKAIPFFAARRPSALFTQTPTPSLVRHHGHHLTISSIS